MPQASELTYNDNVLGLGVGPAHVATLQEAISSYGESDEHTPLDLITPDDEQDDARYETYNGMLVFMIIHIRMLDRLQAAANLFAPSLITKMRNANQYLRRTVLEIQAEMNAILMRQGMTIVVIGHIPPAA
jgi:hypothetical protein